MISPRSIKIGLAGELLSGKTTAANFYIEKYDAKLFKFSRLLDQILSVLGLEFARRNEQDLAALLKEQFGGKVLVNTLVENAKHSSHKFLLFDGIREPDEVKFLHQLKGFKLVYIKADLETRFKRMQSREEKPGEHKDTFEVFKQRHGHDADKLITELEQYADYIIENNSDLDHFLSQLAKVVVEADS